MRIKPGSFLFATTLWLALAASSATAGPVSVVNYSFETLPSSGLPELCGGSCAYSRGSIPGWNDSGTDGQWITGGFAGNPNAIDGDVLAFSNFGSIWQDVGTAVAGVVYTLRVDRLHRTDAALVGDVQLEFGGVPLATATGVDAGPGSWSDWTAVYTATAADAGKTITILLANNSGDYQADFDNVRLNAPEPDTFALLAAGVLGLLVFYRTRKGESETTTSSGDHC